LLISGDVNGIWNVLNRWKWCGM